MGESQKQMVSASSPPPRSCSDMLACYYDERRANRACGGPFRDTTEAKICPAMLWNCRRDGTAGSKYYLVAGTVGGSSSWLETTAADGCIVLCIYTEYRGCTTDTRQPRRCLIPAAFPRGVRSSPSIGVPRDFVSGFRDRYRECGSRVVGGALFGGIETCLAHIFRCLVLRLGSLLPLRYVLLSRLATLYV